MSRVYQFKKTQVLHCTLDSAWKFFSDPAKLAQITPPTLGFQVISALQTESMFAGQLIEYRVRPLLGIPVYWMTEITHVKAQSLFIDEQRFGPYSFWQHQHHFREIPGGVEMTDIVHYKIPFWFIGDLANVLIVRKKLKEIFDYREVVAEKIG